MSNTALVVIFVAFSLYALSNSVISALISARLFSFSSNSAKFKGLLGIDLELSSVFLGLAAVGFIIVYNSAFYKIGNDLATEFVVLTIAMAVKLVLFNYLAKESRSKHHDLYLIGLLTANYLMYLSLAACLIYLLSGKQFYRSEIGWIMLIDSLLVQITLSVSLIYFWLGAKSSPLLRKLTHGLNIVFYVYTALFAEIMVNHHLQHIVNTPYVVLSIFVLCLILWQVSFWFSKKDHLIGVYLLIIISISPLLLALAGRPYLVFSRYRLRDIFIDDALVKITTISLIILLPLISYGLYVIYRPKIRRLMRA